jgi:cell division transport system permease protein
MSGSFDKPTGWPDSNAPRVRLAAERFQALRAQPQARTGFLGGTKPDGGAEPRTRRSVRNTASAPIVPAGSVTGRSLTLVITIMCFLASLTAGAVYMMSQAANQWMGDIASEVTVQVETRDQRGDVERLVAEVVAFLSRQQGVTKARALSVADSSQLLEPWLGQTDALSALPVPRLIAVELDRINPPANFEVLRAALSNNFPGATLDDHRRWQRQVRTITRSFALGGFAILLLVAAATTAIIVSATKSAMASNRDIVEVLHFVGATDRFIAREFERHFLRLGVRAGIVGAIWAIVVFLGMPAAMEFLGGGSVTMAELRRLVGVTSLDLWGYLLLGIVVLVIASLCMVTSRIGVYRILNSQH